MAIRQAEETEAQTRKRLGWAVCQIVDARIPIIAMSISAQNAERFMAMPYWRQAKLVEKMMMEGKLN